MTLRRLVLLSVLALIQGCNIETAGAITPDDAMLFIAAQSSAVPTASSVHVY